MRGSYPAQACWRFMMPFALVLGTATASARAATPRTTTPSHGGGTSNAEAKADQARALNEVQAEKLCGTDRRCRIERLKGLNRARRRVQHLREESRALGRAKQLEEEQRRRRVRSYKPYSILQMVSRLGPLAAEFGLGLSERLRLEAKLTLQLGDANLDGGSLSTPLWAELTGTFLPRTNRLSPYVSAGAFIGSAQINPRGFDSDEFFFDDNGGVIGSPEGLKKIGMRIHGVHATIGLDFQAEIGAHLKAGLTYRHAFYVQARRAKGEYDEQLRRQLRRWFKSNNQWDFVFGLGWAF